MNGVNTPSKALFLSPNGKIYPDTLICSGMISVELNGKPCPYSQNGCLPALYRSTKPTPTTALIKGSLGICALPVQNSNLLIWDIGKGMVSKPFQKNFYLCVYSNAGCGYGWLFQDCMMQNQQS